MRWFGFVLVVFLPLWANAQIVTGNEHLSAPPRSTLNVGKRFRCDIGFGLGAYQNQFKRSIELSQVQDNTPQYPSTFTWPSMHVEAEYAISEDYSLGFHYDFWQDERWYKITNDRAWHHNAINTYMVSVRHYWNGRAEHAVTLYSGFMAGASFEHFAQHRIDGIPESDVTRMATHFTLMGFRFGRTIALATELGIGYKGIFSVGLSGAW